MPLSASINILPHFLSYHKYMFWVFNHLKIRYSHHKTLRFFIKLLLIWLLPWSSSMSLSPPRNWTSTQSLFEILQLSQNILYSLFFFKSRIQSRITLCLLLPFSLVSDNGLEFPFCEYVWWGVFVGHCVVLCVHGAVCPSVHDSDIIIIMIIIIIFPTGYWTQGHFTTEQHPQFIFKIFLCWNGVLLNCWGWPWNCDSPMPALQLAEIAGMHHCTQLTLLKNLSHFTHGMSHHLEDFVWLVSWLFPHYAPFFLFVCFCKNTM